MFVLANYHQLVFKGITEPLGWEVAEKFGKIFHDDYPMMIRSEANWNRDKEFHESFEKVIYLYRNPFDVIISLYYYIEKDKIRQELINSGDIEYYKNPLIIKLNHEELWKYIKDYLLIYIQHLNQGFHHADIVLKYEDLKEDPNLFKEAFLLFYYKIDEKLFKKALQWGSFDTVHKLNPHHARNGSVNQYKEIMTDDMIEYIKKALRDNLREKLMEVLKIE